MHSPDFAMRLRILLALAIVSATAVAAQQPIKSLHIEQVMTASELRETGVSSLTAQQRAALDKWLNRFTEAAFLIGKNATAKTQSYASRSSCVPSVESTISGAFEGWDGETIFKLDNGQIWQQAEYDYMYSYQYRPEVTIYQVNGGCRMKVEDENETIIVRRIK